MILKNKKIQEIIKNSICDVDSNSNVNALLLSFKIGLICCNSFRWVIIKRKKFQFTSHLLFIWCLGTILLQCCVRLCAPHCQRICGPKSPAIDRAIGATKAQPSCTKYDL